MSLFLLIYFITIHKSLNTKDKNSSHQISNFPCTKTHSSEPSDTRQTLIVINNANPKDKTKGPKLIFLYIVKESNLMDQNEKSQALKGQKCNLI